MWVGIFSLLAPEKASGSALRRNSLTRGRLCEWDLRQEKGPVRVLQLRKQCGPVTAVTHVHDQLAVSVAGW